MNEAEWLASKDPAAMLKFLRGRSIERKLRLFAAACARRLWPLLTDPGSQAAVEMAERYADGAASREDLDAARGAAVRAVHRVAGAASRPILAVTSGDVWWPPARETARRDAATVALATVWPAPWAAAASAANNTVGALARARAAEAGPVAGPAAAEAAYRAAAEAAQRAQADLLRELFGNPFRREQVALRWLGSRVLAVARAVHEEGRFDELPILADALEEAGCDSADLLAHCRAGRKHVRGCWALDLLLGRS